MEFTTLFCYRDNWHILLGYGESKSKSWGSFIWGSGFPLIRHFYRHRAQSSESVGRVTMSVAWCSRPGLDGVQLCPFPPSRLSGKKQGHSFLEPVLCSANGQLFLHWFLFVPDCPIPLMGRDLLTKLGAEGKLYGSKFPVVKTPLQVLPTILYRIKNFLPQRKERALRLTRFSSQPMPVSCRSQEFLAPVA